MKPKSLIPLLIAVTTAGFVQAKEAVKIIDPKAKAVLEKSIEAIGSKEAIVDPVRIQDRMHDWPGGALHTIAGGQHEMMMDAPKVRNAIFDQTSALFDAA